MRDTNGGWLRGLCGLALLSVALLQVGCLEGMPDGRGAPSSDFQTPSDRDFGQAVYQLMRREARLHPTLSQQRLQGLDRLNARWQVAATLNAIVPRDALVPTEAFMRSLLDLYDDDTIPNITSEGAAILKDAADTPNLLRALELSARRIGMTQPLQAGEGGFLLRVMDFPKQRELLLQLATWWLEHDGLSDDGKANAPGEKAVLKDFLLAFGQKLIDRIPSGGTSKESLLNDLLLLEDPRLDLKVGKRCGLRVDDQGNAILSAAGQQLKASGATLPPPFPSTLTAPFKKGACGEVQDANGAPLYQIRQLPNTVLGSLLRIGRELIVRDLPLKSGHTPFPFNLPVGIRPLLGALTPAGTFSKQNPILQSTRAMITLAKGPKLHEVIRVLGRVAEKEEGQLAAFLALFEQLEDIGKKHKTAVREGNTLFEDLLPFIQELLNTPGMFEDLLKALQTPGLSEKMKRGMLRLMRFKKSKISEQDYAAFKKGNTQAIFLTPVDHALPDISGNISLFQRLMHLMNDFNRVKYRSKIKALGNISIPGIEMRVDNLALMFLQSVIGKLSIWDAMFVGDTPLKDSSLKGAFRNSLPAMGLSEKPTPEELAAFVNRKLEFKGVPLLGPLIKVNIKLDPIKCKEGYSVLEHHGDALLAALAAGLVGNDGGALKPVALVFEKYGKLERLLDLFALFHRHWGSSANTEKTVDGKPSYPAPATNMRSAEPFAIDILENTDLLQRVDKFGKVMLNIRLSDAPNAPKGLVSLQRYMAFAFGTPNMAYDKTPIKPLLDALDAMDKALAGPQNQRAREAWEGAVQALMDLILQVEGKGDAAKFKNQRAPIVITRIMAYMADEIKKKADAGQWAPDLSRMLRDTEDLITDPITPKALALVDVLLQDRALLDLTTQLLTHALPDRTQKPAQFGEFLQIAYGLLAPGPEDIQIPIGRYLGKVLRERQPLLTRVMSLLKRSIPLDTQDQLTALLKRGMSSHVTLADNNIGLFPELIQTMYRLDPRSAAPLNIEDYRHMFQQTAGYLTDCSHGMEKLYAIIKGRNGPIDPSRSRCKPATP